MNCDRRETIRTAVKLLAAANPQGPNTVSVIGSCIENILIQHMDRLTLITKKGASITDHSAGNSVVVDIEDSHSVALQGFTINGGNGGVLCNTASVCYLTGNTIQDGAGTGVGVGLGSHAFLESNVIQNNGGSGSNVSDGSQMSSGNDVFQGNAAQGYRPRRGLLRSIQFQFSQQRGWHSGGGVHAATPRRYHQWEHR